MIVVGTTCGLLAPDMHIYVWLLDKFDIHACLRRVQHLHVSYMMYVHLYTLEMLYLTFMQNTLHKVYRSLGTETEAELQWKIM